MIAACSSWKWGFAFMSVAWLIAMITLFLVFTVRYRQGEL